MVSAYGEELVAYPCLEAACRSAELKGRRRACIVTMKLSRKQMQLQGNEVMGVWLVMVERRGDATYAERKLPPI
jgi:hypothetical protein